MANCQVQYGLLFMVLSRTDESGVPYMYTYTYTCDSAECTTNPLASPPHLYISAFSALLPNHYESYKSITI